VTKRSRQVSSLSRFRVRKIGDCVIVVIEIDSRKDACDNEKCENA